MHWCIQMYRSFPRLPGNCLESRYLNCQYDNLWDKRRFNLIRNRIKNNGTASFTKFPLPHWQPRVAVDLMDTHKKDIILENEHTPRYKLMECTRMVGARRTEWQSLTNYIKIFPSAFCINYLPWWKGPFFTKSAVRNLMHVQHISLLIDREDVFCHVLPEAVKIDVIFKN